MGVCGRCKGGKWLVVGVLIILNAQYSWLTWPVFIGVLVALLGLLKLVMPSCGHCKGGAAAQMGAARSSRRRR